MTDVDMIRPDLKSLVWAAAGLFLGPKLLKMIGK